MLLAAWWWRRFKLGALWRPGAFFKLIARFEIKQRQQQRLLLGQWQCTVRIRSRYAMRIFSTFAILFIKCIIRLI